MKLLSVRGLRAGYGTIEVLHGIDLCVEDGMIVALLGTNGAGKTTTLRALSGLIASRGTIEVDGRDLSTAGAADRAGLGIAHIPQGRGTFGDFTVVENLELGGYRVRSRRQIRQDIEYWFSVFPVLRERSRQRAGSLSGGEQQMLAVARALIGRPRLLLCDEPSLGLAPAIVRDVFKVIGNLNAETGLAVLIVEQNAEMALSIAKYAYVLQAGTISMSGLSADLKKDQTIRQAYLGV